MIQFDPYELGRTAYGNDMHRDAWSHFPGDYSNSDVEQFHRGWDEAEWEDDQRGLMPQRGYNDRIEKGHKGNRSGC